MIKNKVLETPHAQTFHSSNPSLCDTRPIIDFFPQEVDVDSMKTKIMVAVSCHYLLLLTPHSYTLLVPTPTPIGVHTSIGFSDHFPLANRRTVEAPDISKCLTTGQIFWHAFLHWVAAAGF